MQCVYLGTYESCGCLENERCSQENRCVVLRRLESKIHSCEIELCLDFYICLFHIAFSSSDPEVGFSPWLLLAESCKSDFWTLVRASEMLFGRWKWSVRQYPVRSHSLQAFRCYIESSWLFSLTSKDSRGFCLRQRIVVEGHCYWCFVPFYSLQQSAYWCI